MSMKCDFKFPKKQLLRKESEFRNVLRNGKRFEDHISILFALPNKLGFSRFGVSVKKKFGNAVKRNRIKRQFREAFRLNKNKSPVYLDIVAFPKNGVDKFSLVEISSSIIRMFDKFYKK